MKKVRPGSVFVVPAIRAFPGDPECEYVCVVLGAADDPRYSPPLVRVLVLDATPGGFNWLEAGSVVEPSEDYLLGKCLRLA